MKRYPFLIIAMIALMAVLVTGYNAQAGDKCCVGDGKAKMTSCCKSGGENDCTCKDQRCADGCVNKGKCDNNCKCPCDTKTAASGTKDASCKPGECKPSDCKVTSGK